jgi:hypothetical protein
MKIITTLMVILIPVLGFTQDQDHHESGATDVGVESLSPALRGLLAQEMLALETGMQAIIPAYSSGNWSEIARIAEQIENSYILKQALTDEQKQELHSSLPVSFIDLDKQFHYLAGMLKHVAEKEKSELVGFYFSKLNESCVGCHAQYATHRFPAFEKKANSGEQSPGEHSH